MSRSRIKTEQRLSRLLIWLVSSMLVLLGLYLAKNGVLRAVEEDGLVRLSEQQLQSDLWLISDTAGRSSAQTQIRLEPEGDIACYLLLASERDAQQLRVNGHSPDYFLVGGSAVVVLPPEERSLTLVDAASRGSPLQLSSKPIFIGAQDAVIRKAEHDQSGQSLLQGFFLFSTLFALTLYMFKRSEKYLLFYAAHALIPQIMTQYPYWKAEALAWLSSRAAPLASALNTTFALGLSVFGQYTYVFLNALIHWMIYREFVDDRVGRRPYPIFLAGFYVLLSLLGLFVPDVFGGFSCFYALYFIVYLLEGLMLLRNPARAGDEFFVLTLIAGWAVSLMFWLARMANNLGYISFPFSLGSQVALGYTISFLICINGKFARKFQQADQLLVETRRLNDSLEQQVSERTRDLQTALDDLKTMQENKNRFISNIIHNLKTPLFSLKGYTELLLEQAGGETGEAAEYLGYISGNVDYVQKLIQQLLLFDRLEEKRIQFQYAPISMEPFLEELCRAAQTAGREKELRVQLENALPPAYSFEGDRFYLEQAMLNLLENAVHHSSKGGRILLRAEEAPASDGRPPVLLLSVRDQGEGMRPEIMGHIFERGYSHHANGGKSSGLGLNIALSIARNHGGVIDVASTEGEGSCFILKLPVGGRKTG